MNGIGPTTDLLKDPEKDGRLFDKIQPWLDFLPNSTGPPLDPPPPGSTWQAWLSFFLHNFIPFLTWLLAMIWICYLIFYNSRLVGFIITRLVNRFFISHGYFKVGSFTLSAISGKIMFRDVVYITNDYTIRAQDGWVVFRWWLPYVSKDIRREDFSHCETRLFGLLNALEVHVYNRTNVYKKLEKLFNLPTQLVQESNECDVDEDSQNLDSNEKFKWRDLIPVTKFEISSGKFVFGNNLIPSTLSLAFEETQVIYTSRPAASPHDLFTHIAKCKAENFKVILSPSPKFMGISDEPPRYMGEGFVVFSSNQIEFYYYQDEPGAASQEPETIELASGDTIKKFTSPAWGLDIKCGRGTDFTYGPWADRQREHIYNFFYPRDYQIMEVTKKPKAGEKRLFETFDIRLSTLSDAKIDVLFSQNKETNALHVNCGPGSYLEVTIPWTNAVDGYKTHITGQILHLDATTSLQFRSLAQSETLQFDCKIHYPRIWNHHQEWDVHLTGCKATFSLIYAHKEFFQSLIFDWAGKMRPDILQFVPYTVKFSVVLKEFELLTLANEYNWIDCSANFLGENCQLAVCGDLFDMTFDLPFVEFLPPTNSIKIWIQGESLDAALYLPETNTQRDILYTIYSQAKIYSRDSISQTSCSSVFSSDRKWRNVVTKANGWIDCWSAPIIALSIGFLYWPIPVKSAFPKESEITTPEKEEMLLLPMRPNKSPKSKKIKSIPEDFDPNLMEPDIITLELEIGPSVICLYGSLFRLLWNIKENYLGESQKFFDLSSNTVFLTDTAEKQSSLNDEDFTEINITPFDGRLYRPLEVKASVILHDIQGHLMKCCNENDPACPSIYLEKLSFEIHKTYQETKLQLLLSPINLSANDAMQRTDSNSHLNNGYLTLTTLQFRGQAMFSAVDRSLDSETLEYAWLVEIKLGDIIGRLTLPQVHYLTTSIETFLLQVTSTDCSLQPPIPFQKCLHDLVQLVCPHSVSNKICPYPEDLKYRMVRVSIQSIDFCLVESNVSIAIQLIPVKISTCNLHSCQTSSGITGLINHFSIRQFVMSGNSFKSYKSHSSNSSIWLEVSNITTGPFFFDAATLISWVNNYTVTQADFLKTHDTKTKRLWFLWSNEQKKFRSLTELKNKCGCVGGCVFFGGNKSGVDFFKTTKGSSSQYENISTIYSDSYKEDFEFGESLLHHGEFLLDEKPFVVEEDTDSLDLIMESPFFSTEENVFNFQFNDAKSEEDSKTASYKRSLLSRQFSHPDRSVLTVPRSNISSISPTSLLAPNQLGINTNNLKQRSQSFNNDYGPSDSSKEEEQLVKSQETDNFDDKELCFAGRQLRTKSIESGSTISERYFSAEDISSRVKSSSSNDTIKSDPRISSNIQSASEYETAKNTFNDLTSATTNPSFKSLSNAPSNVEEIRRKSTKDNDSISSTSFCSALSSQEELALVDLHNQMEKPISESPLLMSSYTSHLSHYKCVNWNVLPSLPHLTQSQAPQNREVFSKKLISTTRFKPVSLGFSGLKIVQKDDKSDKFQESKVFEKKIENDFCPGHVYSEVDKNEYQEAEVSEAKKEISEDKTISKLIEFKSEKISILIKINNEVDIKLSPLSLEGLKTFIDSVTPTLSTLHPFTIINHLHLLCLTDVGASNKLKKEKTLYLGQLHAKAWRTLLERQDSKKINRTRNDLKKNSDTSLVANQLEENKTTRIQAFVHINQININLIQASIVEEIISFAALDNIKDLTCVSVLSLCFKNCDFKVSHCLKQKKTLHTFMDQSSVSTLSYTEKALMSRFFSKKQKKELTEIESLTIETIDSQTEEAITSAFFGSLHVQLSRLKNSSSIFENKNQRPVDKNQRPVGENFGQPEAILTIIPVQHSKCGFRFAKSLQKANFNNLKLGRGLLKRQDCVANEVDEVFINLQTSDDDHSLGFIMFECGIENIDFKAVKKSSNEELTIEESSENKLDEKGQEYVNELMNLKQLNLSSCTAKISSVWFNFAAPPKTPNTRRIDYTRLDWHLLSTAAPSITSWLTVSDRFLVSLRGMRRLSQQRVSSVLVYLMTSGLEVPSVHIPIQSKHLTRQFTPLSKSLQDDPSCQLVCALRRLLKQMNSVAEIETELKPQYIPPLRDLQRGVVALCRQWKNSLYMPLFLQQSMKLRKDDARHPLRVLLGERVKQMSVETEEECEENVDETAALLSTKNRLNEHRKSRSQDSSPEDSCSEPANRKQGGFPSYFPRSARGSVAFPLLSAPLESIGSRVNKAYEFLFSPNSHSSAIKLVKLHESQTSIKSSESNEEITTADHPPDEEADGEENLYWWMARQQDYMKNVTSNLSNSWKVAAPRNEQDSKINTLTSGVSLDETKTNQQNSPPGVSFLPTALQHGDVRTIFHPLLSTLKIASGEDETEFLAFGKFGTKVSVCFSIKQFKIDIIESESREASSRCVSPSHQLFSPKRAPVVNFQIPDSKKFNSSDASAFVCENLEIELDLRKVKEYEKSSGKKDRDKDKEADKTDDVCSIVIVGPEGRNQITTLVNFSIDISCISQRVKMPLLRLLHQFAAMYESVKDTRLEIRTSGIHLFRDEFKRLRLKTEDTDTTSQTHSSTSVTADDIFRHNLEVIKSKPEAEKINEDSDSDETLVEESNVVQQQPKCWKTMFYLLDLYETKPETKTIIDRVNAMQQLNDVGETKIQIEEVDNYKGSGRYEPLKEFSIEIEETSTPTIQLPKPHRKSTGNIVSHDQLKNLTSRLMQKEFTPIVVFGFCKIKRVDLVAMMSGLQLEGELSAFHVSLTHKQKSRGSTPKRWHESSLSGQLGQTSVSLLEEVPPNQQLVVKMIVGKSQTLISTQNKKSKDGTSALLTIGPVVIDIPQHPVALHGMMTRSSRQLSTTLQELRSSRQPSRSSRQQVDTETMSSSFVGQTVNNQTLKVGFEDHAKDVVDGINYQLPVSKQEHLIKPIVVQFTVILDSFTICAALLPSLKAQYQMGQVTSSGVTGNKAKFVVDLHQHTLSFNTKDVISETNLPTSASVDLPLIHVSAEYIAEEPQKEVSQNAMKSESFSEGIVLKRGSYLNALADIGSFEHSLTTDLLNHLLLVQKVFMKEVNEVVQKMSGTDIKLMEESIFGSERLHHSKRKFLLFSLHLRLKGIQITATTPTNSALRLETGAMELQLSNRVQNLSMAKDFNLKLFVKLQVDLSVELGQLIKNAIFEEAEPEFQQLAYFKTRIHMRNALQDEMIASSDEKEAVLITLNRPLIYIQPLALDKAVLVWLNYKNAYDYWNEQRANLNKEVLTATQQVLGKVQPITTQFGTQALGTLFLQLTVNDLGACLPITNHSMMFNNQSKIYDSDLKDAVVVTLENTRISACSCGSLVSKGQFTSLCIRFADDFETSLDDWKPDVGEIRNLCVVSEGTYEVCSRTTAPHSGEVDAKWLLNVSWRMEGFDIHVDTSIGKHISALFKTLTALAGDEDEIDDTIDYDDSISGDQNAIDSIPDDEVKGNEEKIEIQERRPSLLKDFSIDTKRRSRLIEKELNEQAKIINDLRQLGASKATIEQEVERLHELEAAVFNSFRRNVIKKLRRPSVKKSSFRNKLSSEGRALSTTFYRDEKEKAQNKRNRTISLDINDDLPQINDDDDDDPAFCESTSNDNQSPESPDSNKSLSTSLLSESEKTTPSNEPSRSSSESFLPEIKSDISTSELKKQGSLTSETGDSFSSSMGQTGKPQQLEPNIDFELDIKIFFNSGKCVLHTKDNCKEEEKRMTKERSFSGGPFELLSPNKIGKNLSASTSRIQKAPSGTNLRANLSASRVKPQYTSSQDFTVFLIPGLDIKLHYNSKTIYKDDLQSTSLQSTSNYGTKSKSAQQNVRDEEESTENNNHQAVVLRRGGTKKATLYAWMTLHSIADETLVGPHLLDFLEQALEPIPITVQKTPSSGTAPTNFDDQDNVETPVQYAAIASFPVDVIVYFHVQPTVVRFTCLPISRVECILQLPSIDLVFSSKRSDEELVKQMTPPKYLKFRTIDKRNHDLSKSISIGGLSVTGCLADFSLYIFHPYGGQKKTAGGESLLNNFNSERKDSLSLQVEFVKINISRTRKAIVTERISAEGSVESMTQSIKFSATCDIGSASFKYDMRRLTEILAFPKAWYRKAIWKRLFIGEQTVGTIISDKDDEKELSLDSSSEDLSEKPKMTNKTLQRQETLPKRDSLWLNLQEVGTRKKVMHQNVLQSQAQRPVFVGNSWQTFILFAVNLSKLNITMNMGNVMGNTNWLTRGLRANGRVSIDSNKNKSFKIQLGLDGSTLDAKGGIVGGIIELSQISSQLKVREDAGKEPEHVMSICLDTLEKRLDYMGTSVLMMRVSDLDVTVRDEWSVNMSGYGDVQHPTKRPALIFIHGVLHWDQLQILMSKSTTPDIMKMYLKLEEFFSQQFHSSKRVFTSLQSREFRQSMKNRAALKRNSSTNLGSPQTPEAMTPTQPRHHRHWIKALQLVSGLRLSTLPNPLPARGTILGGTVEVRARHISLACFYGINFRSKSWGTFSLRQASISFDTEAQSIVNETGAIDTHVVQSLLFSLGRSTGEQRTDSAHKSMAMVCRFSRNVMYPPQFKHMHEWFNYAFSASEIDDVNRFPAHNELEILGASGDYSISPQMRDRKSSISPKPGAEHHHTKEVIFAFPSMQLELKTEHLQGPRTPTTSDPKPVVDCTFVSDFDDHIFVAVDAEAYFFLHELIISYIKEKDSSYKSTPTSKECDSLEVLRDWREFICQTWHLEPTVRLLSWAGKNIEPYGVDYILQRLGFSQARITIPKWIQRGSMDPLDKILSLVLFHIILSNRNDSK